MQITVKSPSTLWDNNEVSVKVDGFCNHAGAVEDVEDMPIGMDDSKSSPILICQCGAYKWGYTAQDEDGYYTEYEDEWLQQD